MSGTPESELPPSERIKDIPRVLSALRRGVRDALQRHKLLGYPAAVWRDGRVVWIQPEDITIPSDADEE